MAFLPILYHDMADPLIQRWNDISLGLHPHELDVFAGPRGHHHAGYRHWPRLLADTRRAEFAHPNISKDGFQVSLDVQQFAPNEISVKTINNCVSVEAKHEERQDDHGYISRQFTRRYALPEGFNADHVVSELSSDGILTIKAPPPAKSLEDSNARVVQILQTGPARLNVRNKEANNATGADQEKKD